MIRYELTGKTALVTGAASGIGLAAADLVRPLRRPRSR